MHIRKFMLLQITHINVVSEMAQKCSLIIDMTTITFQ